MKQFGQFLQPLLGEDMDHTTDYMADGCTLLLKVFGGNLKRSGAS